MALDEGTIFALSSGAGRAGISVVRLSGPCVSRALSQLTGADLPPPRRTALRALRDPSSGDLIDRGLIVRFEAPHSFTGEDVGECHVHGGRAVVSALTAALSRLGLRQAEPGEFTRRAFENGKLDLTEVEGMADLIAAETEAQRRQAVLQMDGALGGLYERWRGQLVRAAAYLEAVIDFSHEDVPADARASAFRFLEDVLKEIGEHLEDGHRGERLRDGFRVAVVGPPNVGKSSLVNALARRDVAIVSDASGTTRDVIEVHLDLDGLPVIVVDTAGLRRAEDEVEVEGIRRARLAANRADLRLFMYDAANFRSEPPGGIEFKAQDINLINKIDMVADLGNLADHGLKAPVIRVSAKTGDGLRELLAHLARAAVDALGTGGEGGLTRERHRAALVECRDALSRCLEARADDVALAAEDVRAATQALGRVTGKIDVETVLDAVFSEFCIGK